MTMTPLVYLMPMPNYIYNIYTVIVSYSIPGLFCAGGQEGLDSCKGKLAFNFFINIYDTLNFL